ncbi:MAG TPA: DUF1844 domain-containing protein, partial [Acidimicrobiales bacterium]|nr:DUF1844 domain-containing protein [Acidimicrobiales bacterium]
VSREPRPGPGPEAAPSARERAGEPTPEEMQARLAELQEQLARTPAEVVVANHAFGLFELAALHLSLQPPQLDQARLAIDALASLVEGLGERLGDHARELEEGLANLRMAYVQIHAASQSAGGPQPGDDAS